MKSLPVLLCTAILVACQQPEKPPVKDTMAIALPVLHDTLAVSGESQAERGNEIPIFHSSRFKEADIYGDWANSNKDSTCVYSITPDVFIYCDRGESGKTAYNFADGTFVLFEEDWSSYEGKVLIAENDTLIIKWEGVDTPDVKVRMKN